ANLTDIEATRELTNCRLNRRLEIERISGGRLKYPMRNDTHLLRFPVPRRCYDRRCVTFDRSIDTKPDRQAPIRYNRLGREVRTCVKPIRINETALARYKPIFNETQVGIGPKLTPHLSEPRICLPWRNRLMCPEHEQAVTGMKIGFDERLSQPALVNAFEQFALALEARIGGRQPASDLARRRRHHFVP